jgi:hypothetical protein
VNFESSRINGGFYSQHVQEREKFPGLKLPALESISDHKRKIKTGNGYKEEQHSLSGFYSVGKNIMSRDKIEINNHMAVLEILSPQRWAPGMSLSSSVAGRGF